MPEYKLDKFNSVEVLTDFLKGYGFSVIKEFDEYTYRHDIYQAITTFNVHYYYRMSTHEGDRYLQDTAIKAVANLVMIQLFDKLTEGRYQSQVFWLPPDSTTI